MKKIKALLFLVLMSSMFGISCSKDEDDGNTSRVLKYEVTGNFTGSLIASYTTTSGSTANETITSLPWKKEITYASTVTAANIAITGNGGITGQQVVIVIKRGSIQISSTPATTDNAGSFSKAAPVVIF